MDILDWVVRGAGAAFGLLTLLFGLSRISSFSERDILPIWWGGFILTGAVWAVSLIADWALPIGTSVYLANGSNEQVEVLLGEDAVCVPGKSFDSFTWRLGSPGVVTVLDPAHVRNTRYTIGKGTWLINLSPVTVSADMYERDASGIDFEALLSRQPGLVQVSSKLGRPYRMFSQSSFDRVYAANGDIEQRSIDGPCTKPERK